MENTYCVYIHTAPNGKMYIGQTSQKPEARWNNGRGYCIRIKGKYAQPLMARQEYKHQKYVYVVKESVIKLVDINGLMQKRRCQHEEVDQ